MSESAVVATRWRLPARRLRFILIGSPAVFLVMLLVFGVGGSWREGIGLGLSFGAYVSLFATMFVRLEPHQDPPDPPLLMPVERKRVLQIVRRDRPVDPSELPELRSLVEPIGRRSARGVLISAAFVVAWIGMAIVASRWWTGSLIVVAIVIGVVGLILQRRDRNVCAAFLDRT